MGKKHNYDIRIQWTGNLGDGTRNYRAYTRDHVIRSGNKTEIPGSSDPAFRGDPARYNPEELFVASLSACHMLWYLHLCAEAGIVVTDYEDNATGIMEEDQNGGGTFLEVVLHPVIWLQERSSLEMAGMIHSKAHEKCFIASSVKFPVRHVPVFRITGS